MANFYENLAGGVGSDLESDVSDVNPAEMAKMLQGLDDMDDALFKSSKKQAETKTAYKDASRKETTSAQAHSIKSDKQHVTFNETTSELKKKTQPKRQQDEDFDWDDPLGDILSSDESIGKSKSIQTTQRKRGLETGDHNQVEVKNLTKDKSQKEKLVSDLFGFEETRKNQQEKIINKSRQTDEPQSLESYLDKKSSQKADTTASLNDDTSKVWSVSETAIKKTAAETSIFKTKVDQTNSDDLLMELGLESDKKSKDLFSGKSNLRKSKLIMDDIFTKPEKTINTNEPKKNNNKEEPSTDGGMSFGNYAPSLSTTRESRRSASKRETSSIGDPLGLFSPPTTPYKNQMLESNQKTASNLPLSTPRRKSGVENNSEEKSDWLGLSVSKEERPYSSPEHRRNEKKISKATPVVPEEQHMATPRHHPSNNLPEWLGGTGSQNKQSEQDGKLFSHAIAGDSLSNVQSSKQNTAQVIEGEHLPTAQGLTLQLQNQMDQEANYALQLQEQQLRTALQFRQHELQLANVHERQQALLQRQEEQMHQLLTQQAQRQKQMESQLQLQQQKIADYLQALITQPPPTTILPILPCNVEPMNTTSNIVEEKSLPIENPENRERKNEEPSLTNREIKMQLMELQIALQQCQLEKTILESTLENLQTKHKEEMHLMEECYRRQVSILEEAMEQQSARLKAENERIEGEYKECLTKMQDQQAVLSENHAQQMAALQKEHIRDMQALKNQHTTLIEHIQHIQHAETSAVQEASQNMTILKNAVEQLGRNTDNLGEMHEWLEKQSCSQTELRELALKTKEEEVQAYKENLTRQRQAAEEDRKKLLGLVEQLEMQVAQQRSKAEEERYTLRQETVRLDTRIEAFDREKERVKAEIERERQHVEKARRVLLEEQKTVSLQLKEEKLSVAKERARIQALAQLHGAAAASEHEVMKLKAEAEAALTVAKEATDQVEAQKLVLQEQHRQLEKERRHLQDLEHNLTIRARELEALTQTALATRNEGAEALASAVQAEERQKQRAVELQRQLSEVKEREQRLSEEKIILSQERMKIHRSREQKICPSCRGSMSKSIFSAEQSLTTEMDSNKFVDPKKIILKLVAEKERDVLLSSSLHSASK